MNKIILAVALAALAMPAYAQGSKSTMAPAKSEHMSKSAAVSTPEFVKKATTAGMFEIQSSQLAEQKSQDPKVQDFAKMMITDHTKANDELKSKVQGMNGVEAPTTLDPKDQAQLDKLKSASGTKFLRQYRAAQIKGHREAVSLFKSYSEKGDNADLKAWAKTTLPTLEHHLKMARALPKSAEAAPTVGSGSSTSR